MTPQDHWPKEWADLREAVGRIDERTKWLDRLATRDETKAISDRVSALESDAKWAKRSAIVALITASFTLLKSHLGIT